MRLVVQRVKETKVTVEGEVVGQIKRGLLVLLGIHHTDTEALIPKMVQKLIHLRIFSDAQDKMNLSVQDIEGEVLVVSQFTLYGNCEGGRRPDFLEAASPSTAEPLYIKFCEAVRQVLGHVQMGRFGAKMDVSLINDGPVTLVIEKNSGSI